MLTSESTHRISFIISFKFESKLASFLNKILTVYVLICGSSDCVQSYQSSKSKRSLIPLFLVKKAWLKISLLMLTFRFLFSLVLIWVNFTNTKSHRSNDIHFIRKIIDLFEEFCNIKISSYFKVNIVGSHVSENYSVL